MCIVLTGLDPARPLIERHASESYRLTRDDANVVQIIHTNAGTLGQESLTGSIDLCINGGSLQPFCRRGLRLSMHSIFKRIIICAILSFQISRMFLFELVVFWTFNWIECVFFLFGFSLTDRNRCSHFLSVCYLANAIFKHKLFPYKACPRGCVQSNAPLFGLAKYTFKPYQYSSLIKLMHIGQDVPEE